MTFAPFFKPVIGVTVLAVVAAGGYLTRVSWMPGFRPAPSTDPAARDGQAGPPTGRVLLTDEAIRNLGLTAQVPTAQSYWKTILVPGFVVDRPGLSDRGVTAPASGVVSTIHHIPGDIVRPGDVLFTLRLLSESLHMTQTELFRTTQDIKLAQTKRTRLAASDGTIPKGNVIEVDDQITRMGVSVRAYRQELLTRGLTPKQIDQAAEGTFVKEIRIVAPERLISPNPATNSSTDTRAVPTFEVQDLKAELGQQVQAGQALCLIANHQKLAIEGRAFPDETPLLERAVKEGWPVEVDFQESPGSSWPSSDHVIPIQHLANAIDPVNRTFAFLMSLENQSRIVERDGQTQMLWRFRPGQKVRLRVRVEKLENVFVLPVDAVAWDGPVPFVFTQNVNTFERKPVRVLVADRDRVAIANDGSLTPGVFVAQAAAAQLHRMTKSQSNRVPKGYHVHADGSLHKNEDEGK